MSKSLQNSLVKGCCKSKSLLNFDGAGGVTAAAGTTITQFINNAQIGDNVNPPINGGPSLTVPDPLVLNEITAEVLLRANTQFIAQLARIGTLDISEGDIVIDSNIIRSENSNIVLQPVGLTEDTINVTIDRNLIVLGTYTRLCTQEVRMKDHVPTIGWIDDADNGDITAEPLDIDDRGIEFDWVLETMPGVFRKQVGFIGYDKDEDRFVMWKNAVAITDKNFERIGNINNRFDIHEIHTSIIAGDNFTDPPGLPDFDLTITTPEDINMFSSTENHDAIVVDYEVDNTEIHTIDTNGSGFGRFIVETFTDSVDNRIELNYDFSGANEPFLDLKSSHEINIETSAAGGDGIDIISASEANLLATDQITIDSSSDSVVIEAAITNILRTGGGSSSVNPTVGVGDIHIDSTDEIFLSSDGSFTIETAATTGLIEAATCVEIMPRLAVPIIADSCLGGGAISFESDICIEDTQRLQVELIEQKTTDITITSTGNVNVTTTGGAGSNIELTSSDNITITAADILTLTDGPDSIVLNDAGDTITITAGTLLTLTDGSDSIILNDAGDTITITAGMLLTLTDGTNTITLNDMTDDITITAGDMITTTSLGDTTIESIGIGGAVRLQTTSTSTSFVLVDDSTENITIDAEDDVIINTGNSVDINSSNSIFMDASDDVIISANTAGSLIQIQTTSGTNIIEIDDGSSTITLDAPTIFIHSADTNGNDLIASSTGNNVAANKLIFDVAGTNTNVPITTSAAVAALIDGQVPWVSVTVAPTDIQLTSTAPAIGDILTYTATGVDWAAAGGGGVVTLETAYNSGAAGSRGTIDMAPPPAIVATDGIIILDSSGTVNPIFEVQDSGGTGILTVTESVPNNVTVTGKLTVTGLIDPTGLLLAGQIVAPAAPGVGDGLFWVDSNLAPSRPFFTDDAGTDSNLFGSLQKSYEAGTAGSYGTLDMGAASVSPPAVAGDGIIITAAGTLSTVFMIEDSGSCNLITAEQITPCTDGKIIIGASLSAPTVNLEIFGGIVMEERIAIPLAPGGLQGALWVVDNSPLPNYPRYTDNTSANRHMVNYLHNFVLDPAPKPVSLPTTVEVIIETTGAVIYTLPPVATVTPGHAYFIKSTTGAVTVEDSAAAVIGTVAVGTSQIFITDGIVWY